MEGAFSGSCCSGSVLLVSAPVPAAAPYVDAGTDTEKVKRGQRRRQNKRGQTRRLFGGAEQVQPQGGHQACGQQGVCHVTARGWRVPQGAGGQRPDRQVHLHCGVAQPRGGSQVTLTAAQGPSGTGGGRGGRHRARLQRAPPAAHHGQRGRAGAGGGATGRGAAGGGLAAGARGAGGGGPVIRVPGGAAGAAARVAAGRAGLGLGRCVPGWFDGRQRGGQQRGHALNGPQGVQEG
mmetsp:Transcript_14483/g.36008  ORF Transcript_14483/g.36008 Transcript_14483/m.36008 type:complete len:235 (-) Transcript_14483:1057-1761(-)